MSRKEHMQKTQAMTLSTRSRPEQVNAAYSCCPYYRCFGAGAILMLLLCVLGCASHPPKPLQTAESVDLQRYMGTWYEIARLPNHFQSKCASDVQARYRMDGGVVRVLNRCRKPDGTVTKAKGIAKVVPGSGNAKLRVSFFWPFYGNYWILALDPEYRWVLVGEPRRKYGWILSRTTSLDGSIVERVLTRAEQLGYDRAAFQRTRHIKPIE